MLDHTPESIFVNNQAEESFKDNKYAPPKTKLYKDSQLLMEPFNYVHSAQHQWLNGSRFMYMINEWCKLPQPKLDLFLKFAEVVVDTDVIMQDIYDGTVRKNGCESAPEKYGIARAINCTAYGQFGAIRSLRQLDPDYERIAIDQLIIAYSGAGLELFHRDTVSCPTEQEYLRYSGMKTAGLLLSFAIPAAKTAEFNQVDEIIDFTYALAVFYTFVNDWTIMKNTKYHDVRSETDDFAEGRFNSLFIYAIQAFPNDKRLIEILKIKPKDRETIAKALRILEELGAYEHVRTEAKKALEKLKQTLTKLPFNKLARDAVDGCMTFLVN